jgi:hypothetical protein
MTFEPQFIRSTNRKLTNSQSVRQWLGSLQWPMLLCIKSEGKLARRKGMIILSNEKQKNNTLSELFKNQNQNRRKRQNRYL